MAGFPDVVRADYVRLDIKPGQDVDVVGDIHSSSASLDGSF
jgi:hypothetical protein